MTISWVDEGDDWWFGSVGVVRPEDDSYDVYLVPFSGLWVAEWNTCVWDEGCYDFVVVNLHPDGPDGEGFATREEAISACEEHHKQNGVK